VVVALLVACTGSSETESERCERVRDKLVELHLASATQVDRDAHRKAMRAALGAPFMASCRDTMTAEQRDCVLAAADLASATACRSSH
jgi:hypothetical protein